MTNRIPVKAIYTDANVTSLGEYVSGDTISTTYTDAKVISVAGAQGIISNTQIYDGLVASGQLTTTNVTEGNNLYFSNSRVYANVILAGFYDTVSNSAPIGATESGTTLSITHLNSGVTPGTYGNASFIPSFTVNETGHITSVSNVSVAGVSSFSASGNNFTISTADGGSFTASIQENSVRLGTDTTGVYIGNLVAGTGVTITNLGNEGATPTVAIGQEVATTSDVQFAKINATGQIRITDTTPSTEAGTGALIVSGGASFSGNILPATDNVYSLGSATLKYKDLYLAGNTIYLGNLSLKDNGTTLEVYDDDSLIFTATSTPGFTNSTITTFPGSVGDSDYGTGETFVGENAQISDAFGVSLGTVFDMMEPKGKIDNFNFGVLT